MCNVTSEDRISTVKLKNKVKLNAMAERLQKTRLLWSGYLEIKKQNSRKFEVGGILASGRRRLWNEAIIRDLEKEEVSKELVRHKNAWRSFTKTRVT